MFPCRWKVLSNCIEGVCIRADFHHDGRKETQSVKPTRSALHTELKACIVALYRGIIKALKWTHTCTSLMVFTLTSVNAMSIKFLTAQLQNKLFLFRSHVNNSFRNTSQVLWPGHRRAMVFRNGIYLQNVNITQPFMRQLHKMVWVCLTILWGWRLTG